MVPGLEFSKIYETDEFTFEVESSAGILTSSSVSTFILFSETGTSSSSFLNFVLSGLCFSKFYMNCLVSV